MDKTSLSSLMTTLGWQQDIAYYTSSVATGFQRKARRQVETLLYMLAVVFGIIEVPSVTIYGVWRGKDELDWQHERVKLDARSPSLASNLEGDLSVVESYEELNE